MGQNNRGKGFVRKRQQNGGTATPVHTLTSTPTTGGGAVVVINCGWQVKVEQQHTYHHDIRKTRTHDNNTKMTNDEKQHNDHAANKKRAGGEKAKMTPGSRQK